MPRLPLNLPSTAPVAPACNRLRDAVFFCIAFVAVFFAALLAMDLLLG